MKQDIHEFYKQIFKLAINSKAYEWKYEEEYRIIDFNFTEYLDFPPEALRCIIFGLNISAEDERKLRQILDKSEWIHVEKYRIQKRKTEFKYDIIKIN